MQIRKVSLAFFVAVFFLLASGALMAQASASGSAQLWGTVWGSYDPGFEGNGAWVGYALISLNGGPARKASMADRNTSVLAKTDGSLVGSEVITLTFLDGSGALSIEGHFSGIPGRTPSFNTLYELGTILNGTGKYSRAKGEATIVGPFIMPGPDLKPATALWIAEIYGTISGVE
jgi:hypothetical protein